MIDSTFLVDGEINSVDGEINSVDPELSVETVVYNSHDGNTDVTLPQCDVATWNQLTNGLSAIDIEFTKAQEQLQNVVFSGTSPNSATSYARKQDLLKAWLVAHLHHPYPSRTERTYLAKKSGLTEIQVQNWFSNARARLLKIRKISKITEQDSISNYDTTFM